MAWHLGSAAVQIRIGIDEEAYLVSGFFVIDEVIVASNALNSSGHDRLGPSHRDLGVLIGALILGRVSLFFRRFLIGARPRFRNTHFAADLPCQSFLIGWRISRIREWDCPKTQDDCTDNNWKIELHIAPPC